jgi:hypothetical protein
MSAVQIVHILSLGAVAALALHSMQQAFQFFETKADAFTCCTGILWTSSLKPHLL